MKVPDIINLNSEAAVDASIEFRALKSFTGRAVVCAMLGGAYEEQKQTFCITFVQRKGVGHPQSGTISLQKQGASHIVTVLDTVGDASKETGLYRVYCNNKILAEMKRPGEVRHRNLRNDKTYVYSVHHVGADGKLADRVSTDTVRAKGGLRYDDINRAIAHTGFVIGYSVILAVLLWIGSKRIRDLFTYDSDSVLLSDEETEFVFGKRFIPLTEEEKERLVAKQKKWKDLVEKQKALDNAKQQDEKSTKRGKGQTMQDADKKSTPNTRVTERNQLLKGFTGNHDNDSIDALMQANSPLEFTMIPSQIDEAIRRVHLNQFTPSDIELLLANGYTEDELPLFAREWIAKQKEHGSGRSAQNSGEEAATEGASSAESNRSEAERTGKSNTSEKSKRSQGKPSKDDIRTCSDEEQSVTDDDSLDGINVIEDESEADEPQ